MSTIRPITAALSASCFVVMNRTQASVDAVFFDLFGTLVRYRDMASAWDDWLKALAEIIGQKPEQLAGHCEGFMSQPEPKISEDGLTLYERRLRRLCGELEISSPPALLHEAATATISAWAPISLLILTPGQYCVICQLSFHWLSSPISTTHPTSMVCCSSCTFGSILPSSSFQETWASPSRIHGYSNLS